MEIVAVRKDGVELGLLRDILGADIDVGSTNDFVLTIDAGDWLSSDLIRDADHWYAEGYGEAGGRIKCIKSSTKNNQVQLSGYTWRGMLSKKIIEPPEGEDYRIVSGEANTVLAGLIDPCFDGFFVVSDEDSGIEISKYQFKRYTDLLSGIVEMLYGVSARIEITYHVGGFSSNVYTPGYVSIRAVPIVDYSDEIEYSQDGMIDFTAKDYRMGVNHLICLGKGELKDRQIVHLYMDEDGNVSQTQTFTGVDEITETYDYSTAESLEDLISYGTARLKERANYKKLEISLNEIDAQIGDIVGGRERITGISLKKQIQNIILKIDGKGSLKITHKVGD